jgi:hypothetical protein
MFSVTRYGKELDKSKYNWDEENNVFSTNEDNLVLDFSYYIEVVFKTGHSCTFKTGDNCTFTTGSHCTFTTGSYGTFTTGYSCTFHTGFYCTFKTGDFCTFKTGHSCKFNTGENCFVTRHDVKGVTEIPQNKTIKLNGCKISGYTEIKKIKEKIKEVSCDGKVVEIEGKKYKLVSV